MMNVYCVEVKFPIQTETRGWKRLMEINKHTGKNNTWDFPHKGFGVGLMNCILTYGYDLVLSYAA